MSEGIGLGVCVIVAMAVVSYLIYLQATSQGHSSQAIGRGLVTIWMCLGAAIAVLMVARAALGDALFDVSLSEGKLWWQSGESRPMYITVAAAAILVGLMFIALRTARNLQQPAAPSHNDQNTTTRGGLRQ